MTPEEKSLLERAYHLAEENNRMLHSIRRASRWSLIMRILYWAFIIAASVGAAFFIQPYLDALVNASTGAAADVSKFQEFIDRFK